MSKEETFGPVATITIVDDADEAVTVANQTTYGLSAGIPTRDADRGFGLAGRIEAGIVHINEQAGNQQPPGPLRGGKGKCERPGRGWEAVKRCTQAGRVTTSVCHTSASSACFT